MVVMMLTTTLLMSTVVIVAGGGGGGVVVLVVDAATTTTTTAATVVVNVIDSARSRIGFRVLPEYASAWAGIDIKAIVEGIIHHTYRYSVVLSEGERVLVQGVRVEVIEGVIIEGVTHHTYGTIVEGGEGFIGVSIEGRGRGSIDIEAKASLITPMVQ